MMSQLRGHPHGSSEDDSIQYAMVPHMGHQDQDGEKV